METTVVQSFSDRFKDRVDKFRSLSTGASKQSFIDKLTLVPILLEIDSILALSAEGGANTTVKSFVESYAATIKKWNGMISMIVNKQ